MLFDDNLFGLNISISSFCFFQLPKPKSKFKPNLVELHLSDDDDDDLYNANVNEESNGFYAEYSQAENSDDKNFIDDGSIDEQYSDTSSSEVYKDISLHFSMC